MLIPALILASASAATPTPPGQWSVDRAQQWFCSRPTPAGCNFLPSTACNSTEMWQKETFDLPAIDRELHWARQTGLNSVRVFLPYIVWKSDPRGFMDRLRRFVACAGKHHLSVMPILFDDCAFAGREPYLGRQDDPKPGVHNGCWTPSPGKAAAHDPAELPNLERYVRTVVRAFARDRRIYLWDLYNEPADMGSMPLVEHAFAWARAEAPDQPLSVGAWTGMEDELSQRLVGLSDVVTFHGYEDVEHTLARVNVCRRAGRPVVCTEWMARTVGSTIQSVLPMFQREGVGSYMWGLVAGRIQTYMPWGSPEGSPEPKVWHHDLYRADGTPFDPREVAFLRARLGAGGVAGLKPLFDFPVRDTCVCYQGGWYYLTGTTGAPTWWQVNQGIRLWRSRDMKSWEWLGLVWQFGRDTTWQKPAQDGRQALWAPEIHYARGTFWLTYCINYSGTGLLRSTSGRAEGPYVDVSPGGPITGEIDASLFVDDDGAAYFVYQNGKIAPMKDDMTGLAEEPRLLVPTGRGEVGFEGAFLFRANGLYHLCCADFQGDEYHCYVATSKSLRGPYGPRRLAVPHGGHNMFFQDARGKWWSTLFGNDGQAPFLERPAVLPVEFGLDGGVRVKL